jgi:hypothetical protein
VQHERQPVSIITVFNDPEVRCACLDRSVQAHRDEAPEVEYLAIDNTEGRFASAGAALNYGAERARHDYLVFVHQDVYLHSLAALERAAGILAGDTSIGLLGAAGPTAEGRFFGRIRDRVILVGEPAVEPTPVDSVDELLFMIPRRVLQRVPLPEEPALAWHAYAVDFGLRVRADGLRVCAVDIPVTHNSRTINLERLEDAYAAIAKRHPEAMPVITPQGRVGAAPRLRDHTGGILSEHRWRYRWLRESYHAHAGHRAAGRCPCVLADIRLDIDDLLSRLVERPPLLVLSVDHSGLFADEHPDPLSLTRAGRPIRFTSRPLREVLPAVSSASGPVLVTNLELEDVGPLAQAVASAERVLGFRTSIGYWMLLGVRPWELPAAWRTAQATPLGMSRAQA